MGSSGASRISAASFAKGATDKPWNELVQSMFAGSSSCSFIGTSEKPDARVAGVDVFEDEGDDAGGVLFVGLEVVADRGAGSALWEKDTEK